MSDTSKIELPPGWQIRTVGDVADFVRGVTYQKSQSRTAMEDGYVALIRATNISDEKIAYDEFVYVPEKVVKKEQRVRLNDMILAASSGSSSVVGKSAPVLVDYVATFGAFCAVLRPSEKILARYFHLFVQSPTVRETWSALARGTNINNLKREQALGTEIPMPPLAEQEKIVEILEEQLSRLDAALSSVRTVREKTAQFRRSLLHAAFTGALTGPSPDTWGNSALRDVATLSLGKMLDRKRDDGSNSTKYLRNINVRWGEVETDDLLEMGINPEQLDRVSLRNGDVVVCEGGEPGRAAIWTGGESIAIQKALHRVRPHEHVEPRFLSYFLESEFRGVENHPLFTGTTIKHLPKEKIATLRVPLPSAVQQREIVDTVDEHLTRFDASLAIAVAVEKRAAALRRSLLHAAFTGKLTEQWRKGSHV